MADGLVWRMETARAVGDVRRSGPRHQDPAQGAGVIPASTQRSRRDHGPYGVHKPCPASQTPWPTSSDPDVPSHAGVHIPT